MAGSSRVGVLALQGDVREHVGILRSLGADVTLVRRPVDLAALEAIVLPGGESTVIEKLARAFGLREPLRAAIAEGLPVYGTCAGLILLAERIVDGADGQEGFGGLDVTVQRNAFGSQSASFEADLEVAGVGEPSVHAVFIRAPVVVEAGPAATPMAALPDGRIVAVRQGNRLGTSFHPEMTGETRFHRLLLDLVHER